MTAKPAPIPNVPLPDSLNLRDVPGGGHDSSALLSASSGKEGTGGDLAGVVLAGGQSRRFGRDKTALCVPCPAERTGEKGQSLVLRAAGVLERLLGDPGRVFVSCRPLGGEDDGQGRRIREEVREHGYGIVEDLLPEVGTLRAVYSALEKTRRSCLVMPCDLPCMNEATLGELLAFRQKRRLEPEPCLLFF